MKVADLMTLQAHVCRAEDTLRQAACLLRQHDCGCLPVVDAAGCVIGMITDRDICMAGCEKGPSLQDLRVADAMSRPVRTCQQSDSFHVALNVMNAYRVRRIPVVDGAGRLLGLLSLDDLARGALDEHDDGARRVMVEEVVKTLAILAKTGRHLRESAIDTMNPRTSG